MNELALFAGAGGGILGGHLLGWRTVCAVEWEAYPASVLVARQNDKILPPFPIWDDVQTFDGKPWAGIVDVVSGGFPCQDISAAGKGGVLLQAEVQCGNTWRELLAKFDPDTALWKTAQCSLLEDLEQSLEIWPRWGSMRNGECFRQPMLVQITKEKEFGFVPNGETYFHTPCTTGIDGGSNSRKALKKRQQYPTPIASDCMNRTSLAELERKTITLATMAAHNVWPTPDANCGKRGTQPEWTAKRKSGHPAQYTINQAVRDSFSTPVARMWKDNGTSPSELNRNSETLAVQAGGKLNPTWVEWLMGWPLQWTDLKPLEMDKSLYV